MVFTGVNSYCNEMSNRVRFIKQNIHQITDQSVLSQISEIEKKLSEFNRLMYGDGTRASREFETFPGLLGSLEGIVYNLWATSQAPTGTYQNKLTEIKSEFSSVYQLVLDIKMLMENLDKQLDQAKFPYTPCRLPDWKG
jgi:hypothetical protein